MIDQVPANVTAEIIPKTLFGEKYVSLVAPDEPTTEHLQAGDTITRAKVPIEVETLLNDLYPLLTSIDPAKLSYTLSAVSQALDGRGEKLGKTLVKLNNYLTTLNPDVPQLVTDLVQLGDVSDGYADAMPQIGRTLENTVTTGNTIVAKRAQLAAFFDEGTSLADTLTAFFKANGKNMEALAKQSRSILEVEAKYSSTFPCFFNGLSYLTPRASSVLRNRTVHIDLEVVPDQPTAYKPDENAKLPSQALLDEIPAADVNNHKRLPSGGPAGLGAVCDDLNKYEGDIKTDPWSQANPFPTFPASVYQFIGLNDDHNGKFGSFKRPNQYYPRAAAANGLVSPSLDAVDSEQQRAMLAELAGAVAGVPGDEMPDVASLMLSPVIRGSEVSIR
jgi:virulence factor Mce-like protein